MAKVYVTQVSEGKNMLPARDWGHIEYVMDHTGPMWKNMPQAVEQAMVKLANFNPDEDYILPLGDPVAIAIATMVVGKLTGGRFQILKWDRQECDYYVVQVDVPLGQLVYNVKREENGTCPKRK